MTTLIHQANPEIKWLHLNSNTVMLKIQEDVKDSAIKVGPNVLSRVLRGLNIADDMVEMRS